MKRRFREAGNSDLATGCLFLAAICLIALIVGAGAWGCPKYSVYSKTLEGEAELAQAESNRQIAVLEANAKKDSSKALAEAEVERAKGIAAANKIIGGSLEGNDDYLRYLWIQALEGNDNDTIYVPTEAGLPILEANRKQRKEKPVEDAG